LQTIIKVKEVSVKKIGKVRKWSMGWWYWLFDVLTGIWIGYYFLILTDCWTPLALLTRRSYRKLRQHCSGFSRGLGWTHRPPSRHLPPHLRQPDDNSLQDIAADRERQFCFCCLCCTIAMGFDCYYWWWYSYYLPSRRLQLAFTLALL